MYTPPKPPEQGKIRLPRATEAPNKQGITDIYTQASDNRPREVEVIWTDSQSNKTYCLIARFDVTALEPCWTLWEDSGGESTVAWKFDSSDMQLLDDMISMTRPAKVSAPAQQAAAAPLSAQAQFEAAGQSNRPQPDAAQVAFAQPAFAQPVLGQPGMPAQQGQAAYAQPAYAQPAAQPQGQPQAQPQYQPQPYDGGSPRPYAQPQPTSDYRIDPAAPQARYDAGSAAQSEPAQGQAGQPGAERPPGSSSPAGEPERPYAAPTRAPGSIEGPLSEMPVPVLLKAAATNQQTGKLEIIGEESVGEVYFEAGNPTHAATPSAYGDAAIKELVTWEKGTFLFTPELRTSMRSITRPLDETVAEGKIRADQKRHLRQAGLTWDAYLVCKQKDLGDSELKLSLTKAEPMSWELQRDVYHYLRHKRTFTDLLRDKPMDSEKWTVLLYNFLTCGLIEIKEAEAMRGKALDFLGEGKGQVDAISSSFIRPETGIYHAQALLYFALYEYYRFEAYNYPLSLIVFQMQKKREDGTGGADLLNTQAANAAAMRIDLVKRPLDTLGHYETVDYALLLPNTSASSAAFVANRMYETLTATPLVKGLDRSTLLLAFGVANLPADGDDLQSLFLAAKKARDQAARGSFPVVLSRSGKK